MHDVHIRLTELTAFVIAVATVISSICSGIATILGAINHRRMGEVQDSQRQMQDSVNGRVEELATAKAGQALMQAAVAASPGGIVIQSGPTSKGEGNSV